MGLSILDPKFQFLNTQLGKKGRSETGSLCYVQHNYEACPESKDASRVGR